jgi:predicted DNA-binding transcriptional regulator YafY
LSRIENVEITSSNWKYEPEHCAGYIDIFRISSFNRFPIKIRLGLLSVSLLTEEYPLAEKYLEKINDNEWILETEVCSYEGISRFLLGLLHDIEILETDDLKEVIKEKLQFHKKIMRMS